jgi:5-methylcytosine-specific restriction endonuclease McrA
MVAKTKWRNGGWAWSKIKVVVRERDAIANNGAVVCEHCGRTQLENPGMQFPIDHIVPCSKGGGELDLDNLWTVCKPCNDAFGAHRKSPEIERRALKLVAKRNRAEA